MLNYDTYKKPLIAGRANRKILEELEEQKKRLLMQNKAPAGPAAPVVPAPTSSLYVIHRFEKKTNTLLGHLCSENLSP